MKVLRPVTLQWLDARHGRSSEKRSSPLISAGVQSSEGLCFSHRLLRILMASALFRPTHMRICANLPQRFAVSAADSHRIAKADALIGPRSVSVQGLPLSLRTDARQGWASFSAVTVSSQKILRWRALPLATTLSSAHRGVQPLPASLWEVPLTAGLCRASNDRRCQGAVT